MEKSGFKWLFFLCLLTPVAIALIIILHRHRQDPYKASQVPYGLPSPEIHREWAHQNFTTIKSDAAFFANLKKIPIHSTNVTLTDPQKAQLQESIERFIIAYHSGNYQDYLRFRIPAPATLDDVKNQSDKQRTEQITKTSIKDGDVHKAVWEVKHGTNEYWSGLALNNAGVIVQNEAKMPEDLTKYALSVYKWGAISIQPSFIFARSAEQILQSEGNLTYATGSFIILPVEPDPPALVHIRFYWDSHENVWIPWSLVISHNGNFKRLPIF